MPSPWSVLRPDGFHGPADLGGLDTGRAGLGGRHRGRRLARRPAGAYFEGWYCKLVSAERATRLAVIPGVFRSQDGSTVEAFVQVLDGMTGNSSYHRFEPSEFAARRDRFEVRVGANSFSANGMRLDVPGLSADVRFGPMTPWPVTVRQPGAMGWYAWVPTMECYHGVVSFDHALAGWVRLAGQRVDLAGGRGYAEKDWGTAFPQAYVWIQSNHFGRPGLGLVATTALIPWRRSVFRGDLVGLRVPGVGLRRFATYTGARTVALAVTDHHVDWVLQDRRGWRLELHATVAGRASGLLHAPVRTQMHKRVAETLDGTVDLRLADPDGRRVLADTGGCAGVEVHGEIPALLATPGR